MSSDFNMEEWLKGLDEQLERNHEAFVGQYAKEVNELMGLSRDEIDEITPDTTDLETYDQLITVVKEASRKNISQALLKQRILEMGDVAVSIAKKSAKLASLFI